MFIFASPCRLKAAVSFKGFQGVRLPFRHRHCDGTPHIPNFLNSAQQPSQDDATFHFAGAFLPFREDDEVIAGEPPGEVTVAVTALHILFFMGESCSHVSAVIAAAPRKGKVCGETGNQLLRGGVVVENTGERCVPHGYGDIGHDVLLLLAFGMCLYGEKNDHRYSGKRGHDIFQ